MSTALLTDHYELTMLSAALQSGAAHRRATFEVFARSLPAGRRYGVLAGTGRLLSALAEFRFGPDELTALTGTGVVDAETADWLAGYRFGGDVRGFAEGEPYLPGTPVLVVEGTFAECVLLETLALSILNHDSAVAAAGARMVAAARGRPLIEMGSRRTHEEAAVAAARAAYLVGFAATSNLEAARRWGVPSTGTSAHAFILAHPSESEAFAAQIATLGVGTTLLVDTYDIERGIANAVAVAGPGLGAIRIDSGDLVSGVRAARAQLDALGATRTTIIVTGDLDEHGIARLAGYPADGYGVGTSLVTGSGAPTAGFVYKLVEIDGRPVAKTSIGKVTRGGRKDVVRRHDGAGLAVADLVLPAGERPPGTGGGVAGPLSATAHRAHATATADGTATADAVGRVGLDGPAGRHPAAVGLDRALLRPLMLGGIVVDPGLTGQVGLRRAREHHRAALADLPSRAREVTFGHPCLPVIASVARS